jgi:hypothetical protein
MWTKGIVRMCERTPSTKLRDTLTIALVAKLHSVIQSSDSSSSSELSLSSAVLQQRTIQSHVQTAALQGRSRQPLDKRLRGARLLTRLVKRGVPAT